MTVNVRSSSLFRRNTPGRRLGSIKRKAIYRGQLYTFQYTSWSQRKKGDSSKNMDMFPVIILAYKNGSKIWEAGNKKRFIYGFNLNYLSEARRLAIAHEMQDKFTSDVYYSYDQLKSLFRLPVGTEDTIFRKYDIRGGKLRYLKEVDLNKYVSYLDDKLKMDTEPKE